MNTGENNGIFKLQSRFLYMEMLFLCLIASLCIISWFPSIFSLLAYEMIIRSALRAAIFLNGTALAIFLLYRHLKSEIQRYSITLSDDQLIKRGFSETTSVRFSEITGIKYVRLPILRGYLKIFTSKNGLIIPLYIENPSAFISALQTKLSIHISDLNLIEDITVFHDSYKRSVKALPNLIVISLSSFFINTIIAVKFWELALIPILLFAMIGLILPLIAYTIADIRLNRSVRNILRSDTAVIHNASTEYLYCGFLIFVIYLFIGILFKAVFLWYS